MCVLYYYTQALSGEFLVSLESPSHQDFRNVCELPASGSGWPRVSIDLPLQGAVCMLVEGLNQHFWSSLDAYQTETDIHQLVWFCGLNHADKLCNMSVIIVTEEMLLIFAR